MSYLGRLQVYATLRSLGLPPSARGRLEVVGRANATGGEAGQRVSCSAQRVRSSERRTSPVGVSSAQKCQPFVSLPFLTALPAAEGVL